MSDPSSVSRLSCRACVQRSTNHVYCVQPEGAHCVEQDPNVSGSSFLTCDSTDVPLQSRLDCAFQTPRGGLVFSILLLVVLVVSLWVAVRRRWCPSWLLESPYRHTCHVDAAPPLTEPLSATSVPVGPSMEGTKRSARANNSQSPTDASHSTPSSDSHEHSDIELDEELLGNA